MRGGGKWLCVLLRVFEILQRQRIAGVAGIRGGQDGAVIEVVPAVLHLYRLCLHNDEWRNIAPHCRHSLDNRNILPTPLHS